MKIELKKALQLGLDIAGAIFPNIAHIEELAKAVPVLKGKAKEDAVIELLKNSSWFIEDVTDKEILNEEDVEAAIRDVIKAVISLQNLIKKKAQ